MNQREKELVMTALTVKNYKEVMAQIKKMSIFEFIALKLSNLKEKGE